MDVGRDFVASSNVAYQYGVSGPFLRVRCHDPSAFVWYLGDSSEEVCSERHTICKHRRDGVPPLTKYSCSFASWTNIIVSSLLILGGAAIVNALTGMDIYAAGFLIPMGVIVYTMAA